MNTVRRLSYVFLCIVPFLNFVVVGVRAFRVAGVYQVVGVMYLQRSLLRRGPLAHGQSEPMRRTGDCSAWPGHSW